MLPWGWGTQEASRGPQARPRQPWARCAALEDGGELLGVGVLARCVGCYVLIEREPN